MSAAKTPRIGNVASFNLDKSVVQVSGPSIPGILEVQFDFNEVPSTYLQRRLVSFILSILSSKGLAGLKEFYGDKVRINVPEVPSFTTEDALAAFLDEWLATRPAYAQPGPFNQAFAASADFIMTTQKGEMAYYLEFGRTALKCRPAVLLDGFAISFCSRMGSPSYQILNPTEIRATPWPVLETLPAFGESQRAGKNPKG